MAGEGLSPGRDLLVWFTGAFLLAGGGRLLYMQILDPSLQERASHTVVRRVEVFPLRGTIYDRNGIPLATSESGYVLQVIPRWTDTGTLQQVAEWFQVSPERLIRRAFRWGRYSVRPVVLLRELSPEDILRWEPGLSRLRGIQIQISFLRRYPLHCCAHVIGYLAEVDSATLSLDTFYQPGDLHGIAGIEAWWEKRLRGRKGYRYVLVDPQGRIRGSYRDGELDLPPVPGQDIWLTIDSRLQAYAESLLVHKRGAVVMIEIRTGDVLVLASSPGFVLDSLVGRNRPRYFLRLLQDPARPMMNRAISGVYPPGSTVKPLQVLAFVSLGAWTERTSWSCPGVWSGGGNLQVGCHLHPYIQDVRDGISYSCNGYFCMGFVRMIGKNMKRAGERYTHWREFISRFGISQKLGIELPGEAKGFLPDTSYYNRRYGVHRWNAYTIVSLAIGQGEWLMTPLQLAYMTALIASGGNTPPPRLTLRPLLGRGSPPPIILDSVLLRYVHEGMEGTIQRGTARNSWIPGLCWAGKTGTAENPHGEDHSLFVGYAPCEDPQVAISVVIEHGGFGATISAPLASLVIARYFGISILQEPSLRHREEYVRQFAPAYP